MSSIKELRKEIVNAEERLINTKKESQVGSDAWKDYKVLLISF